MVRSVRLGGLFGGYGILGDLVVVEGFCMSRWPRANLVGLNLSVKYQLSVTPFPLSLYHGCVIIVNGLGV